MVGGDIMVVELQLFDRIKNRAVVPDAHDIIISFFQDTHINDIVVSRKETGHHSICGKFLDSQ